MTQENPTTAAGEQEIAETVSREFALATLSAEIGKLIKPAVKYIDEARAKKLRRDWDALQPELDDNDEEVTRVQGQLEALRLKIHEQVETRNAKYAEIEKLVQDLGTAIGKDDLQSSQQLEQKIISELNRTRGLSSQRQQAIIQALETLQPKIKKLVSWRHWGTAKAREQVIAEIRSIHDTEKDLDKIAKRIKQAREQWKQWDNSGEGGDKKLYQIFDKVCTEAYEPCKILFEKQRKQRESASKHRKVVCETLENFYENADWRAPDWKAIQQLLREQSVRWRQLGAAEFRDRKPLQKRYDAIVERFNGPLDRERKRNLVQRQELIASIEKLAELDDTRRAVNELQKLKKDWRVTVSGKRKQEQAIWKQFTAACDTIYDKGRASKKAFEKTLDEHLAVKRELCEEIESALKEISSDSDHDEFAAVVRNWKQRWSESGHAPKADARKIDKRYQDAIKLAERLLRQQKSARRAIHDKRLFAYAALCAELEAAVIANAPDSATVAVGDYQNRWSALVSLEAGLQSRIEERWKSALTAAEDPGAGEQLAKQCDKRFAAINELLLQLEIHAEVDSPREYARQRMALQINRLSAAMGKAPDTPTLGSADLIEQIHLVGPVRPEQQAQIDQRFKACYEALQTNE